MKRLLAATTAILAAGLAISVSAQEVKGKAEVGEVQGEAEIDLPSDSTRIADDDADQITYRSEREKQGRIGKANKASGVIGMEVKNRQGEMLGEIQDLVIDWSNGRVSYAVLSTGGFLGLGEKYIAVPPSAFRLDGTDDRLVLNVDKAKVEQAPGFAKTNWPEVQSPAWGAAAEWGRETDAADTERRALEEIESDVKIDAQGELQGDYERRGADFRNWIDTREGRLAADFDRSSDRQIFKGRVTAVDVENGTFSVEGQSGRQIFTLAERPFMKLQSNRYPSLVDLKVGYNVTVEYQDRDGQMMAHKIIQTSPTELK